MAPAITHFLIGAALLLFIVRPVALRYDINRENVIWLIPLGGLWGIAPDVHHIDPVFADTLYAFHNSPWADLFGLHYTLDRQAVRARYYETVFGAIGVFILSVAAFWGSCRVRNAALVARRPVERVIVALFATGVAAGFGTLALGVTISVQEGFTSMAGLVGATGVFAGGLVTVGVGVGLGAVFSIALEGLVPDKYVDDIPAATGIGGGVAVLAWVAGVVLLVPRVVDGVGSIPFFHAGSLVSLIVYGAVFGCVYAMIRGAFAPGPHERSAAADVA